MKPADHLDGTQLDRIELLLKMLLRRLGVTDYDIAEAFADLDVERMSAEYAASVERLKRDDTNGWRRHDR